MYFYCG